MYPYKLNRDKKNTIEIIVDIKKETINEQYQKSFLKLQKELTVPGFRKGKAPKNIAEKNIKKDEVYQELIKDLLPEIYGEILKKENLKPIISPKIELIKAKEDEDWQIKITLAEKPLINLGDYKTVIKKIKNEAKKADIWIPGKDKEKKEKTEADNYQLLNKVLSELLNLIKFEISDLIVEQELNHRLTELLDDIKKIGLTVDGYLQSKKTTMEELKKKMTSEIIDGYKIEFILQEIADKEDIKVEDSDLDKLFSHIKDEKEKEEVKKNAYFYAALLRKQKTIDFLLNL
ncbi:MAG: trigger factor [Patescibacteria group bacterium]|nr:trigger factor [Patescibacteria group bacterium]